MLIAQHDLNGIIWFEEYHLSPADRRRIAKDMLTKQSAMFQDRPDLWHKPPRKPRRIPAEQMLMFSNPNELHLNFIAPISCKIEGRG